MKKIVCLLIALVASIASIGSAGAYMVAMDLGYPFSGDTPSPIGNPPWLRVTFDDQDTPGTVILTMEAVNLRSVPEQYVNSSKGWYLNFDPNRDATSLQFTYKDGISASRIRSKNNVYKADGDGLYDINIEFSSHAPKFEAGSFSSYLVIMDGITADSFVHKSEPGGGERAYYTAAHVTNTPGCDGSGWIGALDYYPVPVPETAFLFLPGIVLFAWARSHA